MALNRPGNIQSQFDGVIRFRDASINTYQRRLVRLANDLERKIVSLAATLDKKDDRHFAANSRNLATMGHLQQDLERALREVGYTKSVVGLLKNGSAMRRKIQDAWQQAAGPRAMFSQADTKALRVALGANFSNFADLGTQSVRVLRDGLTRAVTQEYAFETWQGELRQALYGEGRRDRAGHGMFRHAYTLAETAMSNLHRTMDDQLAENAGVERFEYYGPKDRKNRDFCRRMIDLSLRGKTWTRDEIDKIDNSRDAGGAGPGPGSAMTAAGGWNCRHVWLPVVETQQEEAEREERDKRREAAEKGWETRKRREEEAARGHVVEPPVVTREPGEFGLPSLPHEVSFFRRVSFMDFDRIRAKMAPREYKKFLSPIVEKKTSAAYNAREVRGDRAFLSPDGRVGYILTAEGDFQSLFNGSKVQGAGAGAVVHAIENGAKTLDAFDGFLPEYYKTFGFVEVKRDKWNEEYAPKGWSYEKFGRPDVVYMEFQGGDRETVRDRYRAGLPLAASLPGEAEGPSGSIARETEGEGLGRGESLEARRAVARDDPRWTGIDREEFFRADLAFYAGDDFKDRDTREGFLATVNKAGGLLRDAFKQADLAETTPRTEGYLYRALTFDEQQVREFIASGKVEPLDSPESWYPVAPVDKDWSGPREGRRERTYFQHDADGLLIEIDRRFSEDSEAPIILRFKSSAEYNPEVDKHALKFKAQAGGAALQDDPYDTRKRLFTVDSIDVKDVEFFGADGKWHPLLVFSSDEDIRYRALREDEGLRMAHAIQPSIAFPPREYRVEPHPAPFDTPEWGPLSIQERREKWSKLTNAERDELGKPLETIPQRIRELIGDVDIGPRDLLVTDDRIESLIGRVAVRDTPKQRHIPEDEGRALFEVTKEFRDLLQEAKASREDTNFFVNEFVRNIAAQDYEAMGRTLGDHGIRHIKGNIDASLAILNVVPGIDTTEDKLAVFFAAMTHDSAYLTPPAREFLDADHLRWATEFYRENYRDRVEQIIGEKHARLIEGMIGTHDSAVIDWSTQHKSMLSAFRVADNLALFHEEKLPYFLELVPENRYVLEALGSGSIDVEKAKSLMRANISKKRDLTEFQMSKLFQAVDEVSPILPKLSLGMYGSRIDRFEWTGDYVNVVVRRDSLRDQRITTALDLGQEQFIKFAKSYGIEPGEIIINRGFIFERDSDNPLLGFKVEDELRSHLLFPAGTPEYVAANLIPETPSVGKKSMLKVMQLEQKGDIRNLAQSGAQSLYNQEARDRRKEELTSILDEAERELKQMGFDPWAPERLVGGLSADRMLRLARLANGDPEGAKRRLEVLKDKFFLDRNQREIAETGETSVLHSTLAFDAPNKEETYLEAYDRLMAEGLPALERVVLALHKDVFDPDTMPPIRIKVNPMDRYGCSFDPEEKDEYGRPIWEIILGYRADPWGLIHEVAHGIEHHSRRVGSSVGFIQDLFPSEQKEKESLKIGRRRRDPEQKYYPREDIDPKTGESPLFETTHVFPESYSETMYGRVGATEMISVGLETLAAEEIDFPTIFQQQREEAGVKVLTSDKNALRKRRAFSKLLEHNPRYLEFLWAFLRGMLPPDYYDGEYDPDA